VNGYDIHNAS